MKGKNCLGSNNSWTDRQWEVQKNGLMKRLAVDKLFELRRLRPANDAEYRAEMEK